METKDYLEYIVDKIHRTIIATTDDEGLPVTCAIDMMDFDEESLYFLTAKGKGFYDRLVKRGFLAFTAMKGEDTLSSVAVSVRGKVRELGYDKIPELFAKNPYMHQIYPTEESMRALTVFQIYEGSRLRELLSRLEEPGRRKRDTSSRIYALAAGTVSVSVRRTASEKKSFHSGSSRNIACIAEIV